MTDQPQAPAPKPAKGLLPGIQLLRGCAALLVIVAHANGIMSHPEYLGYMAYAMPDVGLYGVAVFFTISGFIIAIVSLDSNLRATLPIHEYARRRFIRILPFLWLCVIGYNVFTYLGTHAVEWGPAIRALLIWPVGELKPNVIWSLRHEILFYALFAATMLASRRRPFILALWFLAPLLVWGALLPFDVAATPWHPYHNELFRVIFLGSDTGANLQLGTGFLLGVAWLKGRPIMTEWLGGGLYLAVLAAVVGAFAVTWAAFPPGLARSIFWTILAGITIAIGIVSRSERGPLRALGLALGNASFSIYLVHNPVLLILLELSKHRFALLPPAAWIALYVVIASAAGVVVHHLVEKPLIAALSGKHGFFLRGLRAATTRSKARPQD